MDNDYIHLSLLSQYEYCARRAALIFLENVWQDNEYTVEGTLAHERVHAKGHIKRSDVIYVYDYSICSHEMKLSGKCDCIEATFDYNGVELPFYKGKHLLYPIEYKHGVVRDEKEYNIQLCAQAMCLEEMYGCDIHKGAIFYTNAHRRFEVDFTSNLRDNVKNVVDCLWSIITLQRLPQYLYSPKCKKCSLAEICIPKLKNSAKSYNKQLKDAALSVDEMEND